jgi:hypothetical protein
VLGENDPFARNSRFGQRHLGEHKETMKRKIVVIGLCLGTLAMLMSAGVADANAVGGRVGVYDSRVVAYAWFWSDAQQAKLKEQMDAARAAKQAGDQAKLKERSAALSALQDQMHREVFSTAPAKEALAMIKDRIPEVEKAAGVAIMVSKWDKPSLNNYKGMDRVDVTDRMARVLFKPTEKQLKVIERIKNQIRCHWKNATS